MSYDINESGNGQPTELFHFRHGDEINYKDYFYTSADENIILNGNNYIMHPIQISSFTNALSSGRDSVSIKVPRDNPIVEMYRLSSPSNKTIINLYRKHRTDTDYAKIWNGSITSIKMNLESATINCTSSESDLDRKIDVGIYQKGCSHILYDSGCSVNKDNFLLNANIDYIDNNKLTINAISKEDNYYKAGFIVMKTLGIESKRAIYEHKGKIITLLVPVFGIKIGDQVKLYPGCDKTTNTCLKKFNNIFNHGGFPFMPNEDKTYKSIWN